MTSKTLFSIETLTWPVFRKSFKGLVIFTEAEMGHETFSQSRNCGSLLLHFNSPLMLNVEESPFIVHVHTK